MEIQQLINQQDINFLQEQLQNQNTFNFDDLIDILQNQTQYKSIQYYKHKSNKLYLIVEPLSKREQRLLVIKNQNNNNNNKQSFQRKLFFKKKYSVLNYLFKEYYIEKIIDYLTKDQEQIHLQNMNEYNQTKQEISTSNQIDKSREKAQQSYHLVKKLSLLYSRRTSLILIPTYFNADLKADKQFCLQINSIKSSLHFLQRKFQTSEQSYLTNILSNLSELQSLYLDFSGMRLDERFLFKLSASIKQLPNILEFGLNISDFYLLSSSSISRLISSISHLINLTSLQFNFQDCKVINSKVLSDIARVVQRQPQLYHFQINVQSQGYLNYHYDIYPKLQNLDHLTNHYIFHEKHSFVHALRYCKNLKVLRIDFINNKGNFNRELKYLGETLSKCSLIESLSLFFTKSEDYNEDFVSLAQEFKKLKNMTNLQLNIQNYYAFDMQKLIEQIVNLSNLKKNTLDLQSNVGQRYFFKRIEQTEDIQFEYFKRRKYDKNKMKLKFIECFDLFEASQYESKVQSIKNLTLEIFDEYYKYQIQDVLLDFVNKYRSLQTLKFCINQYYKEINLDLIQFDQCKNLKCIKLIFTRNYDFKNEKSKKLLKRLKRKNKYLVLIKIQPCNIQITK